jgi:hypothetical protein
MTEPSSSSGPGYLVLIIVAIVVVALVAIVALQVLNPPEEDGGGGLPLPTLIPPTQSYPYHPWSPSRALTVIPGTT